MASSDLACNAMQAYWQQPQTLLLDVQLIQSAVPVCSCRMLSCLDVMLSLSPTASMIR